MKTLNIIQTKLTFFGYENEINCIFKEEISYFENAQFFVSRNNDNSIVGTIRVLKWNYTDILSIQKIFNVDVPMFCNDSNLAPVWHIGRFAIRKGVRDINLFKQLMVCAITPVCHNENAVAYAECDSKLLRVLLALGIKAESMGKSINYLGSETIPVKMPYTGLIDFYTKNQVLASMDFLSLNTTKQKNYTFV